MEQAELEELTKKYLDGIAGFLAADAFSEYPTLSDDQIIPFIRNRTNSYKELRKINDAIIEKISGPFIRREVDLDEEGVRRIEWFADAVTKAYPNQEASTGLEIYRTIFDYAYLKGDKELYIRMCLKAGLAYFNLRPSTRSNEDNVYFKSIIPYQSDYFSFSKETRKYFCRALGNIVIGIPDQALPQMLDAFLEKAQIAKDFFQRPDVRAKDPDFPFDRWYFLVSKNITTMLHVVRCYERLIKPEYFKILEENSTYVYQHCEEFYSKDSPIYWQCVYAYYASLFHVKKITIEELLDDFTQMINSEEAKKNPYSSASLFCHGKITGYYLEYCGLYFKGSPEEKEAKTKASFAADLAYLENLNKAKNDMEAQHALLAFIISAIGSCDLPSIEDQLYSLTVKVHLPTFVHTEMVRKISSYLAQFIYAHDKLYFLGQEGLADFQSLNNPVTWEKYLARLDEACKFHDLGKYYCLNEVSDYYRSLNEDEMNKLKIHPEMGDHLLGLDPLKNPSILSQVIYCHHIWHNRVGGYPYVPKREEIVNQKTVDIVEAADSLDAATDNIGHAFSDAKSLDEVLREMESQAGSRYAPEITRLFTVPEVYAQIKEILSTEREKTYISCVKQMMEKD
jgi:HD-GYP domain-containing protein (c-di-GMP phosphodiesterase class II)